MRHLELFAGIGGFRTAMNYIQKDLGVINNVIGYSEIETLGFHKNTSFF